MGEPGGPMPHSRSTTDIRFYELDSYNHLNHTVYLAYCEIGRIKAMKQRWIGMETLDRLGYRVIVVDPGGQVHRSGRGRQPAGGGHRGRTDTPGRPRLAPVHGVGGLGSINGRDTRRHDRPRRLADPGPRLRPRSPVPVTVARLSEPVGSRPLTAPGNHHPGKPERFRASVTRNREVSPHPNPHFRAGPHC